MTTVSHELDDVIHEIACIELGDDKMAFKSDPIMARFKETGTELWVDTGDLQKAKSIWKTEFTALTTNNTLANQVVQTGVVDEVIGQTVSRLKEVAPGLSEEELVTDEEIEPATEPEVIKKGKAEIDGGSGEEQPAEDTGKKT